MKTETIIGFILALLALAGSTLEASASLLGISQQTIAIIGLVVAFLTSAWEMYKRLPESEAKKFAKFYDQDVTTLERNQSKNVDDAFKQWKSNR